MSDKHSFGIIELLLDQAFSQLDQPFLETVDTREITTYRELLAHCEKWRGVFERLGVRPGDAVVLQLPTGVEWISAFLSLVSIGAMCVPVSTALTAFELGRILDDCKPKGIVTHRKCISVYSELLLSHGSIQFVLDTFASEKTDRREEYARVKSLEELAGERIPLSPPSADTVVTCHYTYKGLGYPLGSVHTYSEYSACLKAYHKTFPLQPQDAFLVVLPVYPIFGLLNCVLAPIAMGAKIILASNPNELDFLATLERYKIRSLSLVPAQLKKLVADASKARQTRALDLHPELLMVAGGSYLEPALTREAQAVLGIEPLQGYGLTETLPITTNLPKQSKAGTLGVLFTDETRLRIVDADGVDVPQGRVGEVLIQGPTVSKGYLNKPRETAMFYKEGWLKTGDLGWVDGDGHLNFLGRRIRITKVMGQMTDLKEIESVITNHPKVAEARVSICVNKVFGEYTSVSVVVKPCARTSVKEIAQYCKEKLSRFKVPREIKIYQQSLVESEPANV